MVYDKKHGVDTVHMFECNREILLKMYKELHGKELGTYASDKYEWDTSLSTFQSSTDKDHPPLDMIIFGKEINKAGARYYCRTSFDTFIKRYGTMDQSCKLYHDQPSPSQWVRLTIDIDAPKGFGNMIRFGTDDSFVQNIVYNIVIEKIIGIHKNLQKTFRTKRILTKNDFRVMVSCTDEKYSVHILCKCLYFTNTESLRNFTVDLLLACNEDLTTLKREKQRNPGVKMYNFDSLFIRKSENISEYPLFDLKRITSMRMYDSTKTGQKRPLRLYLPYTDENTNSSKEKDSRNVWHKFGRIIHEYDESVFKDTLMTYIDPAEKEKIVMIHYPDMHMKGASDLIVSYNKKSVVGTTLLSERDSTTISTGYTSSADPYILLGLWDSVISTTNHSNSPDIAKNSKDSSQHNNNNTYQIVKGDSGGGGGGGGSGGISGIIKQLRFTDLCNKDNPVSKQHKSATNDSVKEKISLQFQSDILPTSLDDLALYFVQAVYDTAGLLNFDIRIAPMRDMKLSQSHKRFLIPIIKGPCLEKLDNDKKTHTQPSGLALILDLETRIATMFCQKEYMNKRKKNNNNKKANSPSFISNSRGSAKIPKLEFLGSNHDSNSSSGRPTSVMGVEDNNNEIKWYKNIPIPDEFYNRLMSLLPKKLKK